MVGRHRAGRRGSGAHTRGQHTHHTSQHNTVTIRHLGILTVPDMARVWPLLLGLQLASCLELYQLEWQLVEGGQCGANMSYNR